MVRAGAARWLAVLALAALAVFGCGGLAPAASKPAAGTPIAPTVTTADPAPAPYATPSPAAEPADLVLRGAAVYTVDAARSWATAVAVRSGRIVYVGDDAGAAAWTGPATRVLDLPGRMVLPAFEDAHVHPVTSGVEIGQCDLLDLPDRAAVLAKVRECAGEQKGEWLLGAGWQLPIFPGASPGKELLDEIAPGRPVFLAAADGHSAWVSSRALEMAGIDAATPNPPGGRIERRPGTAAPGRPGEPAGTLRESAVGLVKRRIPPPSLEERLAGLRRAQDRLLAHGVTAVQDAAVGAPELEAYRAAAERGELKLKVVAAIEADPDRGPEQVAAMVELRRRFVGPRLHPTAAKIFLDGVIEARTAAMVDPYLDRPGERGELLWEPERLDAVVAALAAAGFDVHVHAIGDRAVRVALDSFAKASEGRAAANPRPRNQIAHLEVIDPADVPRFARLGVIANFQPLWAFADSYIVELTWPALGPERSQWIYPMGSVHRAGGPLAFGSDWSVSSLDPLEGIQVAVTRTDPDGDAHAGEPPREPRNEPMLPDERLDLPTALAAYTVGAAWANRLEAETGTIEVGKAADLVVLSENLFALPPDRLATARVLLTLVDGEVVYTAPDDDLE